jgi:hypothetical protein
MTPQNPRKVFLLSENKVCKQSGSSDECAGCANTLAFLFFPQPHIAAQTAFDV